MSMIMQNPVLEHLKRAAEQAPFKLEKENYQMAMQEIERLQHVISTIYHHVHSEQEVFIMLQRIKHILQAHTRDDN